MQCKHTALIIVACQESVEPAAQRRSLGGGVTAQAMRQGGQASGKGRARDVVKRNLVRRDIVAEI